MAVPGYAKSVEIHKCSICKQPATRTCVDCNKPICGLCMELAQYTDKKVRCPKDYEKHCSKYGNGTKK